MRQKLIDIDKLSSSMYHEAFETDTDMQKWDSGCWIRYKLFERQLEAQPIVEAIPVEWIKSYCAKQAENDKIDCYWTFFEEDVLEMIGLWRTENENSR